MKLYHQHQCESTHKDAFRIHHPTVEPSTVFFLCHVDIESDIEVQGQ